MSPHIGGYASTGPTSSRPRRSRYPVTRRLTKFTSGAHGAESIEFRYSLSAPGAVHPLSLTCRIGLFRKRPRVDSRASGLKPPPSVFSLCCRCQECPVVKPTFLCGNDNRTYSSPCRLEYHNCIHHTSVHIACKGFCPCKGKRYICPRASRA